MSKRKGRSRKQLNASHSLTTQRHRLVDVVADRMGDSINFGNVVVVAEEERVEARDDQAQYPLARQCFPPLLPSAPRLLCFSR